MKEFIYENYFLFSTSVEFLAALCAFLYLRKYKNTDVTYFLYFLIAIAVLDLLSNYTHFVRPNEFLESLIGTKFEKNFWFSNLYWSIGSILFYSFYYQKILNTALFKKILKIVSIIFFFTAVVYIKIHLAKFFNEILLFLDVVGAIIIFCCCFFYFIEILMSDKVLIFYKTIDFYITATIFIWWLIITPLSFYNNYYVYEVGKSYNDLDFVFLRFIIYLLSNTFMYVTFTFAIIYCKPEKTSIEL